MFLFLTMSIWSATVGQEIAGYAVLIGACNWEVMMEFLQRQISTKNWIFSDLQRHIGVWDIGCHRNFVIFGRYFLNSSLEEGVFPGLRFAPGFPPKETSIKKSSIQWFIHKTYMFVVFFSSDCCLQKLFPQKKSRSNPNLSACGETSTTMFQFLQGWIYYQPKQCTTI